MPRTSDGNRSRVEIDVLFWLRPSFFSLRLPLSILDSLSFYLSLSSIILSFCSASYHAHPLHDYTPFSVATFHFDFPEFPARCQMFTYWIVRTFFPLAPFFLSRKQLRSISLAEKIRVDRALIALRDLAQTMPLFHNRQFVRLVRRKSEIVRYNVTKLLACHGCCVYYFAVRETNEEKSAYRFDCV